LTVKLERVLLQHPIDKEAVTVDKKGASERAETSGKGVLKV